jgi:hypothetical protein
MNLKHELCQEKVAKPLSQASADIPNGGGAAGMVTSVNYPKERMRSVEKRWVVQSWRMSFK